MFTTDPNGHIEAPTPACQSSKRLRKKKKRKKKKPIMETHTVNELLETHIGQPSVPQSPEKAKT